MARLVLRLRLRLLGNVLARGAQPALGLVLGATVGLAIAFLTLAILTASAHEPSWPAVLTLLYAGVWLTWLVLPVLTFSSDDTLDPRRFALLPLRPRDVVPGLLLAALVGVGPVSTLVGAAGAATGALTRTGSAAAGALGLVAALLLVVVSVTSSRAFAGLLADALSTRRGRDVAALASMLVAIAIVLGPQLLTRTGGALGGAPRDVLERLAAVAAWTPGGMAGAAVGAGIEGEPWGALLRLAGVAAWTLATLAVWSWAFGRTRHRTPQRSATRRIGRGLYPRALAWLPPGRTTAVAVRFLRTLARDGRVRNQALSQLFVLIPLLALSGGGLMAGRAPLLGAFVVVPFGLLAANQVGLDGPALWQHLVAGDDPRRDLAGRTLGLVVVGVPTAGAVATGLALATDTWALLPAAVLLSLGLLLTLLGVANAAAVLAPYPIPEDPSNIFGSSSSAGCLHAVLAIVVLLVQGLVALPVTLVAFLVDGATPLVVGAAAGVVYGGAVLAGGTWLGAVRGRGRGPELLAAVDPRLSEI